jgi:hypothetical protein
MPVVTVAESLDPPVDPMMPNIVQGRLTITIDRTNPADGVGSTIGGPDELLRFQLQATSVTRPIDPTLVKFEFANAVDPADNPVSPPLFNDQLILWVQ